MPLDMVISAAAEGGSSAGQIATGSLDCTGPMPLASGAHGYATGHQESGSSPDRRTGAESLTVLPSAGLSEALPSAGLSEAIRAVGEFHRAFNLPRASRPSPDVPSGIAQLRVDLLTEEVGEFADATANRDLVAIADALSDIVYVAYGAAVTYGIDLDATLREVHSSNMSKLDDHGQPIYREDGKVLKSASYTPPDIARVLYFQAPLPF